VQVHHLGLIDYLVTDNEIQNTKESNHNTCFLDFNCLESAYQKLNEILTETQAKDQMVLIVVDMEVLKSKEFQGRSQTAIDGLTQKELVDIFEILAKYYQCIEAVLFTNFNPTVEKETSGLYMVILLYKFIKSLLR
jgi:arginase family enzyme